MGHNLKAAAAAAAAESVVSNRTLPPSHLSNVLVQDVGWYSCTNRKGGVKEERRLINHSRSVNCKYTYNCRILFESTAERDRDREWDAGMST